MTLQTKILQLKLDAALAVRHAQGWQRLIDLYGEDKATAFYQHLGLNHLPAKSVDFDGLTLRREPRPSEAIAVKGVAQAQEVNKAYIATLLLAMRSTMIADALVQLADLNPADYHTLAVDIPAMQRNSLRVALIDVFNDGRQLVGRELARQQGKAWQAEGSWQHPIDFDRLHQRNGFGPHGADCVGYDCQCDVVHESTCAMKNGFPTCSCEFKEFIADDFDELDLLADVTTARVANDTQARIIAAAGRLAMLGTSGDSLITATQTEINAGSVSYIDRTAQGLANRTINLGRSFEMHERDDEIDRYEQSALLDNNVCDPCAADDGLTADNPDDLPGGPNLSCQGSDLCRCFIVTIVN
jgi:hypothetical protein